MPPHRRQLLGHPPEDSSYVVTRMWDQFLPRWRSIKSQPKPQRDPEEEKRLVEEINQLSDENLPSHDERDIDKVNYAQITPMVRPKKGKWLRFSEEQIRRIYENQAKRSGEGGKPFLTLYGPVTVLRG